MGDVDVALGLGRLNLLSEFDDGVISLENLSKSPIA